MQKHIFIEGYLNWRSLFYFWWDDLFICQQCFTVWASKIIAAYVFK